MCQDIRTIKVTFLLSDYEKKNLQITRYKKLKS